MNERPSNVVDFLEFLAARDRSRLPLFDGMTPVRTLPDLTDRPVSAAGVEHRTRMLKHLGAGRFERSLARLVDDVLG